MKALSEEKDRYYDAQIDVCERFAKNGDSDAMYLLDFAKHENGEHKEAFKCLETASKENAEALFMCSVYYDFTAPCRVVEYDRAKAFELYKAAAEKGSVSAMLTMGDIYLGLEADCGVEPDYNTAIAYYNRAADKNSYKAYNRPSDCYRWGKGFDKDIEKAYNWLLSAYNVTYNECAFSIDYTKRLNQDD